jgi:hypothetical protein
LLLYKLCIELVAGILLEPRKNCSSPRRLISSPIKEISFWYKIRRKRESEESTERIEKEEKRSQSGRKVEF